MRKYKKVSYNSKITKSMICFVIDTTVDIIQERLSSPVGKTGD